MENSRETRAAILKDLEDDPRLTGELRCKVTGDLIDRWEDFDSSKFEEWGCRQAAETNAHE